MTDCAVYQCETFFSGGDSGGGNGDQSSSSSSVNIPLRTPASLREYFVGVSTLDRIKAAMVTMDYFNIDYHGLSIFYDSHMRDNADTLQQGQLIIGSQLFNGKSFGHIGAILAHEVEGHWDLQLKGAYSIDYSNQASWMREVQAYRYELSSKNIRRFGLTHGEVEIERSKLKRYYDALTPANKQLVDQGWYKP